MVKIESNQNETFKKFFRLTHSKGLKSEGLFLLSGEKLVKEFLAQPNLKIIAELITKHMTPLLRVNAGENSEFKLIELSSELFAQIDVLGTDFNILVLEQPVVETMTSNSLSNYQPTGIEVVVPIGDPGNLGALLRSCEAFGISRVILTQESANPFLPKAVKASAGSVLRIQLARGPALKDFSESAIALDADGVSLHTFTWPSTGFLVVGEEGPGFGVHHFKQSIKIPTQGVESLNVVVAASIALAHLASQKT